MGRALRLATMGVPVGGGVNYPESITDDFAADSGLWLDGDLAAAAITVSGGRGIWTPTLDATELLTNGDMETGDPPDGWVAQNATLSAETTDPHAGLQALRMTATGTAAFAARQTVSSVAGQWLVAQAYLKRVTATLTRLSIQQDGAPFSSAMNGSGVGTDAYEVRKIIAWASQVNMRIGFGNAAGSAGIYSLADDASMKVLDPETAWRVQRIYYPSTVSVKVWRTANAPAGVGLFSSLTNYIAAIIEEDSNGAADMKLIKLVSDTPTVVAVANITEVAGAVVEIVPNATFDGFSVKYNDAEVITEKAIVDFEPTGAWYAAMIRTQNGGDIDTDAFDDFSAVRVEGAPPF